VNPEGDSAGRLIQACGLKGMRVGGAQVSEVHANFIVNTGGATARDVLDLIERVREAVKQRNGIWLETELRFLGKQA
jgi:UDP-N-acetylmuramate dehydrogenase